MTNTMFHPGESAAQSLAGVATPHAAIRDWMPDQHRAFFGLLPFVPIATVDRAGAPVATILTGAPGFVSSPDPKTLRIGAVPDPADPASRFLVPGAPAGILGIDLATRRRNRANGVMQGTGSGEITISVRQSFGNCPQYIQTRFWQGATTTPGPVEHLDALDQAARTLIGPPIRSSSPAAAGAGAGAMGGADISHRGRSRRVRPGG